MLYFKEDEEKIRIFGNTFVRNNKDKLKIIINGKIQEIEEYYNNKEIKK